ncbi:hypothetical protein AVEN_134676-1 [Araneus ventricosus]|uniref:Uncharacterized protein n=1 Tax=Araneus ventricosus TaxID=182803 RepID=A0A4Y2F6E6_ARAVE|nr:hypothetical protein AVEN_134676-1 [Araneus ventricosus]
MLSDGVILPHDYTHTARKTQELLQKCKNRKHIRNNSDSQRKFRMILRSLLIAGFYLISPSWGFMGVDDFENIIEPKCLPKPDPEGKPFLINGQAKPLAQTIENFIALAEKFEAANPNIGLQNELFYFIRSYIYDNIEFNRLGDIVRWEPKEANFDEVNNFWEPEGSIRTRKAEAEDPFTDEEKCSLFHMLSHSIIRMPRSSDAQRTYTNESRDLNHDFILNNQYPMEQGVVAILGTNLAVELGRVLRGMYVGLQSSRTVDLSGIPRINKTLLEGHQREIDRLYAITLSEVIALSNWRPEVGQREKLAQDGYWVSAPIGMNVDTSDICPQIYRLKANETAAFSYSSMRGAADGLILGKIVDSISANNLKVKLSQILRQYYGRGGIFESDEELGGTVWASFCNRDQLIRTIEETLREQTYLYQLLVAKSYKYFPDTFTWDYYLNQRSSIFGIYSSVIRDFCSKQYTLDKPENFPRETPLDIIAVLDTSQTDEYIRKQQLILGYFAKEVDLRYSGSRMTILTDQRVPSAAASAAGTVLLKTIVEDTFSTACAACAVTQVSWEDSSPSAAEDDVIIGLNQYLQARKANQTEKNGVSGKVVIYFNLEEDQKNARPTPLQTRVEKALIDLRHNHIEVPIYPLGRSTNLVKKYARNDGTFVLSAIDEPEHVIARKLFQRISHAPAILQYPDCSERRNEKSAIFEYFVSPSAVQHWSMPAKYFYKSINMKITFESKFGPIRVCHNRATPDPELQKVSCEDIPNGQKKDFVNTNPCKDFDAISCSPLYFSVIGVNATSERQGNCMDTSDNNCRTLDQTYFKVTHEGVRCSGSAAIMANATLLLLGVFLLNFLSKKY